MKKRGFSKLGHYQRGGWRFDFVVKTPRNLWALEVKSGKGKNPKGVAEFCREYPDAKPLVIGSQGVPLDEYFRTNPEEIF